jgi:8-oxo-dGTP pyrophosphatase MutT (NUDIX family)
LTDDAPGSIGAPGRTWPPKCAIYDYFGSQFAGNLRKACLPELRFAAVVAYSPVVAISPFIAHLRERIGHDVLLMPAVSVIPVDDDGRVLMVRHTDDGLWGTIGGSVELDEAPEDAAIRETSEEAGVTVALLGIRAALGGPRFRMHYPNGDEVAYVSIVFEARVVDGAPRPDGDETSEVAWFSAAELATLPMNDVTRAVIDGAHVTDWAAPANEQRTS